MVKKNEETTTRYFGEQLVEEDVAMWQENFGEGLVEDVA
jgi:hypothetical protein